MVLRKLQKINVTRKLTALSKMSRQEMRSPISLKIGSELTYDRQEWIAGATVFGAERFGDLSNNIHKQTQRLDHLWASSASVLANRRLDGLMAPQLEFWDTLQARAKIRPGSGAAEDGIPGDVYLEFPFIAVARIHKMFSERCKC